MSVYGGGGRVVAARVVSDQKVMITIIHCGDCSAAAASLFALL